MPKFREILLGVRDLNHILGTPAWGSRPEFKTLADLNNCVSSTRGYKKLETLMHRFAYYQTAQRQVLTVVWGFGDLAKTIQYTLPSNIRFPASALVLL